MAPAGAALRGRRGSRKVERGGSTYTLNTTNIGGAKTTEQKPEPPTQEVANGAAAQGVGSCKPTIDPAPEPEAADPYAEERKGLTKYTREGLEDELIEARRALADEKSRRKKAEAERDEFKAKWQEAIAEDDMGRKLGNAQRQRDTAKGRLAEEQAKNARQQRRINKQDAEIKALRRKLEGQEIAL